MAQKKGGFNQFSQDNAGRCHWNSRVSRQRHCLKMGFLNHFCIVIGLTVGFSAIAVTKDPLATVSPQGIAHRIDPITGRLTVYRGVDLSADTGDSITAVADGLVSEAGRQKRGGMLVTIDHHEQYVTRYAHNATLLVHVGDRVHSGQPVARAGLTGRSIGPHLHFDVEFNGKEIDRVTILAQKTHPNVAEGTLLSRLCIASPEQASLKLQ